MDTFSGISQGDLPYKLLYTSNYVIDETVTFLLYEAGPRVAVEVLRALRPRHTWLSYMCPRRSKPPQTSSSRGSPPPESPTRIARRRCSWSRKESIPHSRSTGTSRSLVSAGFHEAVRLPLPTEWAVRDAIPPQARRAAWRPRLLDSRKRVRRLHVEAQYRRDESHPRGRGVVRESDRVRIYATAIAQEGTRGHRIVAPGRLK